MRFRFFLICLFISHILWAQKRPATILKQPNTIQITKLYQLNSSYREVNLNITPDGKYMFFMSSRGQMPWSTSNYTKFKGVSQYDGDIWYSRRVGSQWQVPTCLDRSINSRNGEDEPNVSPDGKTVYFQSWHPGWQEDGGPYYKAIRNGSLWSNPVGLGGGIAQFFNNFSNEHFGGVGTDGMTISPDGKILIVAVGDDYEAPMDLYMSTKNAYGQWSYLKKISLSTPGDDRSPFIAGDGKTLYFASNGYTSLGGMDILKTTINTTTGMVDSKVYNVGAPFNTIQDDYGFIITADGKEVYFIRDGDIHFADVTKSPTEMKPLQSLVISGVVTDKATGKPVSATIKVFTGNALVGTATSNAKGEYKISIKNLKTIFLQNASKTGYKPVKKNLNIELSEGANEIVSNIELEMDDTLVKLQEERRKKEEERKRKELELKKRREEEKLRDQEAAASIEK